MTRKQALTEAIDMIEWNMDRARFCGKIEEHLWYKSIYNELVQLRDEIIVKEIEDEFR